MDAPSAPSATPWHRRVLDWLGVEVAADAVKPPLPVPGLLPQPEGHFPWEPVPPAPRPPQWGAANLPELLLGVEDEPSRAGDLPPKPC